MPLAFLPLDPIVEWAIEFLAKKAIEQAPRVIKKIRDEYNHARFEMPKFASKKGGVIGREKEIRSIRAALDGNETRTLYFRGGGGIGKTRLLEEAEKIVRQFEPRQSIKWAGLIDLYHTDLRDPIHIQNKIIGMIDPKLQFFRKFHSAHLRFQKMQGERVAHVDIEIDRSTLNETFLTAFNQFTQQHRVVLALDTLEALDDAQDIIQAVFELSGTNTVSEWLVHFVSQAQNSVFFLAGRPTSNIESSLQKVFDEGVGQFEIIDLHGLTRDDARKLMVSYAREIGKPNEAILAHSDHIWGIASGVPVQLCLAIELAVQPELQMVSSHSANTAENFKRKIVTNLFQPSGIGKSPIYYLALARKGLSAELLHHLEPGWSKDECNNALSKLRRFNLVKARPDSAELFLHDAVYDLFDQFFLTDSDDIASTYSALADFYRIKLAQKPLNHNHVKCLYYELRKDPLKGLEDIYLRWSEEAISGYNIELEMQLYNEILAFMKSYHFANFCNPKSDKVFEKERILDGAVKWVKRYLAIGQYEKAVELAERLILLAPPTYIDLRIGRTKPDSVWINEKDKTGRVAKLINNAPVSFWGHLLTYYGDALGYIGTPVQDVDRVLQVAIKLSKKGATGNSNIKLWMKNRVLGKAHDRMGYLMRLSGRHDNAIYFYHQAIPYYEGAQNRDELAGTLNNLAFVLAFKGQLQQAKIHAENGLRLRQEIGQMHSLALSYNTKGLIFGLEDAKFGQQDCRRALGIFEEIDAARGVGLACNALGYLLRQEGAGWKSQKISHLHAMQCYEQALKFLDRAENIFSKKLQEPVRLWEALNETGSVFYEMSLLFKYENKSVFENYIEKSVKYFNKAIKVALNKSLFFQAADTYDDLAQLFLAKHDIDFAEASINNTINIAIELGRTFSQNNQEHGDDYWLTLAKIHQQKGFLELQRKNSLSAKKEISLAFDYFKQFSNSAEYLAKRQQAFLERLSIEDDLHVTLLSNFFK